MTKAQMFARISATVKINIENMATAAESIMKMDDCDAKSLAFTISTVGSGIIDVLNNIAIILCETMKEG